MREFLAPPAGGVISVLLGNGDGSFSPAVTYGSGSYYAVAVGDVDGDGKADIVSMDWACANPDAGCVSVLLGDGDGTFQAGLIYALGTGFSAMALADVNGDGKADLLVTPLGNFGTNTLPGTVGVLLNVSGATKSPTTTTFSSSVNPSVFGQAVTFTAKVTSSSGTPTGTVNLLNGSTMVGSGTLSNGSTTIVVPSLPAGANSVTAAYQGNASFAPSTSTPLTQTVTVAITATSLSSSLNPAGTNQSITFTATVTGQYGGAITGSVTFSSGSQTLGTASVSGHTASLTTSFSSVGTYSISAKYNGDGNNTGSTSSPLSEVIITSTTTTIVSSLNPSVVGQAVTFTATVSSSAGAPPNGETITFKNGSSVLGTAPLTAGMASLTTSSLAAGIYTITASYPGDANFAASTSPGLRQVVNSTTKSATATTLVSSLNPSAYGQSVTWTATVTTSGPVPPTGKVNFTWSIYTIGSATLNSSGVATLTKSNLNVDTYPLTAVYVGDASNLGSTSSVVSQVVTRATSSATLTSSPNPSTSGQTVTFTATVTSPTAKPTGPVTFTVGKTVLGTGQLNQGKAKFTTSTLAVGTTTVTATYNGDSNIAGSSASVTQTVAGTQATQAEESGKFPLRVKATPGTSGCRTTTTLTASGSSTVVGQGATFSAYVYEPDFCNDRWQGSCNQAITFYDGNTTIGSAPLNLSTCIATFTDYSLTAKTHKIRAQFPGNGLDDLPSNSNVVTQVVTGDLTATSLSSSLTPSTYGQTVTWTATVTSPYGYVTSPTGKVNLMWDGVIIDAATLNPSGVATLTKSLLSANSYMLTAVYVGDANNASSTSAILNQVVQQAASSATFTSSPNPSTVGEPVTFTAKITSPTVQPTGPVTFTVGQTVLGTAQLLGGRAQFTASTLAAGSTTVTATLNGDSNVAGSSASVTQTVH